MVAPYKVVCGHPDGSHCWGQGSTHCRSLWSQPSGFISTACGGGDGKSLPLLVLLKDGVSACVCLSVLKSPSCPAMHGKRQASTQQPSRRRQRCQPFLLCAGRWMALAGGWRRSCRRQGQGLVLQCPLCPEWQHVAGLCSSSLGRAVSQQRAAPRLACGLDAGGVSYSAEPLCSLKPGQQNPSPGHPSPVVKLHVLNVLPPCPGDPGIGPPLVSSLRKRPCSLFFFSFSFFITN